MENSSISTVGPLVIERFNSDGDFVSQTVILEPRLDKSFNFSGFGTGDKVSPTPGSFHKLEKWGSNGRRTVTYRNGTREIYTGYYNSGYPTVTEGLLALPGAVNNKALGKLYDSIAETPGANVAVSVGERKELYALAGALRHPISGLVSATQGFARSLPQGGNPSGKTNAGAAAKAASSAWLAYKLGIAPLVDDVKNIVGEGLGKASGLRTVTSTGQTSESKTSDEGSTATSKRTIFTEQSARVKYSVTYRNIDPNLIDLHNLTSFNPLLVGYELTAMSFVADWFFDVGGYLEILENSLGIGREFVSGYRTTTQQTLVRTVYAGSYADSDIREDLYYFVGTYRNAAKVRDRLTSFPGPAIPSVTRPFNLGSSRIATAGALLAVGAKTFR
jgi:hypothetical protein